MRGCASSSRIAFDSLPFELAMKKVKGNGERRLAIFSDADCPFCARLETELKNIDNVTIYTFLYPIDQLHPDAARKSRIIWCAPDKVKAWDAFFASGTLPANNGDCDNPLAATSVLGQKLKVLGDADARLCRRVHRSGRTAGAEARSRDQAGRGRGRAARRGEEVRGHARARGADGQDRAAQASATEEQRDAMAIIDFIKKQFIDVIEWTDDSRDTLSLPVPR